MVKLIPQSLIHGLELTPLREIADHRGAVLHMIRCDSPGFLNFGECYFSEILPNAIKGWKRHKLQTQNLAVPIGRVRFVIFDPRESSQTVGQIQEVDIGRPDAYIRLTIPPKLWYGFQCLSINPALIVNCSDLPHNPEECELTAIDNPDIPYHWR